jgi:hypothetical protein
MIPNMTRLSDEQSRRRWKTDTALVCLVWPLSELRLSKTGCMQSVGGVRLRLSVRGALGWLGNDRDATRALGRRQKGASATEGTERERAAAVCDVFKAGALRDAGVPSESWLRGERR